jgi:NAD(P)-dependent dehydrogenase (short-subunit alcohol dehydrogenase family)
MATKKQPTKKPASKQRARNQDAARARARKVEPPPQKQARQPGRESQMRPKPRAKDPSDRGSGKLAGKVALISGGDSGIGRAVAIAFAREGADVAIVYLEEHGDAEETQRLVDEEGGRCLLLPGDVKERSFCGEAVERTVEELGGLDVLVNNAAVQFPEKNFLDITDEHLEDTFRTNILSFFYMTQAALPHLREGSTIVNSTSVTAYRGSHHLVDYASTKGAIVAFTRSLSTQLAEQGIRVNAVAPGPIWTPLIPSTFDKQHVAKFGQDTPLGRPGQPEEVAPSYVFLASDDSSYMTGQVLHPNGGEIVNA